MTTETSPVRLRLGTRGSPLALAQASETRARLAAAHSWPVEAIEVVIIRTSGDRIQDVALREIGGKELFTKEIEAALTENRIDVAVHSAKDVATEMPAALTLAGALPREDVRDALISPVAETVEALPEGAIVGTASLRREALLKRIRPDLETVLLRGNVGTRLRKLETGEMHATLLASAGLRRLDLLDRATALLDTETFPPAPGQGTICLQTRADDEATLNACRAIDDAEASLALHVERNFLAALGGSCHTPVAAHATSTTDGIAFHALVISPDAAHAFERRWAGAEGDAPDAAAAIGHELRAEAQGFVDLG
ncbi:MAG: hydroxymethylbilane synthase [Pseudomonadota bacterium]